MKKISTVDEWFLWRKQTSKKKSVEKKYESEAMELGWDYTDVLYSFLGIYAIGVWVFYSDKFIRKKYMISDKQQNRNIYSFKYLDEHHSEYEDVNELPELKKFIDNYFSIGNVIPIWPGGNSHRGQSHCFDIPEIYFNKNKSFAGFLMDKYKNAALSDIINNNMQSETPAFLDKINKDNYIELLTNIVAVIRKREKALDNELKNSH